MPKRCRTDDICASVDKFLSLIRVAVLSREPIESSFSNRYFFTLLKTAWSMCSSLKHPITDSLAGNLIQSTRCCHAARRKLCECLAKSLSGICTSLSAFLCDFSHSTTRKGHFCHVFWSFSGSVKLSRSAYTLK